MKSLLLLLFLSPLSVLAAAAPNEEATSTPSPLKTIALTFDDGPYGTSTQEVLSILKHENIHATFFLIGKNVSEFPQETRRIVADGNTIGNHTYTHTRLSTLTTVKAQNDIARAERELVFVTGVRTHLFRPPYGILPTALKNELKKEGYRIKMWNDDPSDWNGASSTSQLIVSRTLAQEKDHIVLILHDGRDTKVNYPRDNMLHALPIIIRDLKKQGYTFVTL